MTTPRNRPHLAALARGLPLVAAVGIAALAITALRAPAADAAGGTSIASAPLMQPGQLQTGGGNTQEFWRIQLYAGDRMTVQAQNEAPEDEDQSDSFELYKPSVNDYSLGNSQPVNDYGNDDLPPGLNQFTLTSPFTGEGTIDVCDAQVLDPCPASDPADAPAFSFTVFIAHLTAMSVTGPRYARRGSRVKITGRVSSPAGMPTGACAIDGHFTPLTSGSCSRRVRLGRVRKQIVSIKFLPDGGWQGTSSRQTIHLYKP